MVQQCKIVAVVAVLLQLSLGSFIGAASRDAPPHPPTVWHGPASLIWNDAACTMINGTAGATNTTLAESQAICEGTRGCSAINWLSSKGEYQLRDCGNNLSAPTWSVPGWQGYATFPFPLPPAPPPAPPPLPLVLLTTQAAATGAACLDGSPPGFYWEAGTGADANNWIVFLNGGGWCYNLAPSEDDPYSEPGRGGTSWGNADSCWGRSRSALGSTLPAYNPPQMVGGWLSGTPMANWSKANVIYCDGGSFSGNADAPVVAAGTGVPAAEVNRTLYFRGQRNLDAVIDELKSRGMDKAGTAVLGGCSAGGLGAMVQCDHFSSKLPGANRTRCIGDAGMFLNAESLTKFDGGKRNVMEMQFGNLVAFQNASLSEACLASANNTFAAACFFPQNTLPTQKTPTFVRNSFYNYGDWETLPWNWHNSHNFTPFGGWLNPYSTPPSGTCAWESSWGGCNTTQRAVIRHFQEQFSTAVAPAAMDPGSKHGAFVDNCAQCHCQGMFNGMDINGAKESDVLEQWLLHDVPAKHIAKPLL